MIRKSNLADLKRIKELDELYLDHHLDLTYYQKELENEYLLYLVYEQDKEIIGFFEGSLIDDTLEIYNIVITKEYQRSGKGTEFFKYLINNYPNIKKMILEVRADNLKAINFYKKNDFKQLNIRPSYYPDGMDGLLYVKEIER